MKILIAGISRSGTTLLGSIIGGHKDIAIINEPLSSDYKRIIGKKHSGLKITLGSNITMKHLFSPNWFVSDVFNRFINPFKNIHIRWLPISGYSISQLIDDCDKCVLIERNKQDVISSNINRTGMSNFIAEYRYNKGLKQINYIKSRTNSYTVIYEELIKSPIYEIENICKYLDINFEISMVNNANLNSYGRALSQQ
jgi:hypothetical protein